MYEKKMNICEIFLQSANKFVDVRKKLYLCALQGGIEDRISYVPDAHFGSLKSPVLLTPLDNNSGVKKRFINGILYILRDGKTYTVQGQEVK